MRLKSIKPDAFWPSEGIKVRLATWTCGVPKQDVETFKKKTLQHCPDDAHVGVADIIQRFQNSALQRPRVGGTVGGGSAEKTLEEQPAVAVFPLGLVEAAGPLGRNRKRGTGYF